MPDVNPDYPTNPPFPTVGTPPPQEFCDETDQLRYKIESLFEPGRERSLMLTKLDEVELWATRTPAKEQT